MDHRIASERLFAFSAGEDSADVGGAEDGGEVVDEGADAVVEVGSGDVAEQRAEERIGLRDEFRRLVAVEGVECLVVEARGEADCCVVDRTTKSGWVEGHAKAFYLGNEVEGDGIYFSFEEEFVTIYANTKIRVKDQKFDTKAIMGEGGKVTRRDAEVAAERMLGGVSPENVLVLTAGREAAKRMRVEITRRLADAGMRTAQGWVMVYFSRCSGSGPREISISASNSKNLEIL